jgi:hypothetical protein
MVRQREEFPGLEQESDEIGLLEGAIFPGCRIGGG